MQTSFIYNEDGLEEVTRKFYDLSDMILNRNCSKAYNKIFLHPESLNHTDNNGANRFTQHFYFCQVCARSLACQVGKPITKILKPKYAIVNGYITGQVNIDDIRGIRFPGANFFVNFI